MMGRQNNDQGPLFYEFCLDEAVPDDHLVRKIDAVLDLSWVYADWMRFSVHTRTYGRKRSDQSTCKTPCEGRPHMGEFRFIA